MAGMAKRLSRTIPSSWPVPPNHLPSRIFFRPLSHLPWTVLFYTCFFLIFYFRVISTLSVGPTLATLHPLPTEPARCPSLGLIFRFHVGSKDNVPMR